jgi:hypothetical protein
VWKSALTGYGKAKVPVLRLRQAFWLADVACLYVKQISYFNPYSAAVCFLSIIL